MPSHSGCSSSDTHWWYQRHPDGTFVYPDEAAAADLALSAGRQYHYPWNRLQEYPLQQRLRGLKLLQWRRRSRNTPFQLCRCLPRAN